MTNNKYKRRTSIIHSTLLLNMIVLILWIIATTIICNRYTYYVEIDTAAVLILITILVALKIKEPVYFYAITSKIILDIAIYTADYAREYRNYITLSRIVPTECYNPQVSELLVEKFIPSEIFYDPMFHGNILLPWIPDQPPHFESPDLLLITLLLSFMLQYAYYIKKGN